MPYDKIKPRCPLAGLIKRIQCRLTLIIPYLTELPRWDVNEDGVVDISDLVLVGRHFGKSPPKDPRADVNEDGYVDISDLVLVGRHFGENAE